MEYVPAPGAEATQGNRWLSFGFSLALRLFSVAFLLLLMTQMTSMTESAAAFIADHESDKMRVLKDRSHFVSRPSEDTAYIILIDSRPILVGPLNYVRPDLKLEGTSRMKLAADDYTRHGGVLRIKIKLDCEGTRIGRSIAIETAESFHAPARYGAELPGVSETGFSKLCELPVTPNMESSK